MTVLVTILLWTNLIATGLMCGVILFVQVVHYPMFDDFDRPRFPEIEQRHQRLTTYVVGPPMLVELVCSVALVFLPLPGVPRWLPWVGLALVGVWASLTAFVSIPCHETLARDGYDRLTHQRLVWTNWPRVLAWALHGSVTIAMIRFAS